MDELFYTTKFKKDLKRFRSDFVIIGDFLKALEVAQRDLVFWEGSRLAQIPG